jgi:hypothetical protein
MQVGSYERELCKSIVRFETYRARTENFNAIREVVARRHPKVGDPRGYFPFVRWIGCVRAKSLHSDITDNIS